MEEQIIYKVVQETAEGLLVSFLGVKGFGERLPPDWIEHYSLNVWTTPRNEGSKLFAFRDLDRALRFVRYRENARAFKAKGVGVALAGECALWWWESAVLKDFWQGSYTHTNRAVPGTVICDGIMLLEEIHDDSLP